MKLYMHVGGETKDPGMSKEKVILESLYVHFQKIGPTPGDRSHIDNPDIVSDKRHEHLLCSVAGSGVVIGSGANGGAYTNNVG